MLASLSLAVGLPAALTPLALSADVVQGLVMLILFVGSVIVRTVAERRKNRPQQTPPPYEADSEGGARPPPTQGRDATTRDTTTRGKPDEDYVWGDRKLRNPPLVEKPKAPTEHARPGKSKDLVPQGAGLAPAMGSTFDQEDKRAVLVKDSTEWAEAGVAIETAAHKRRRETLARLGVRPGGGRQALHQAILWREVLGPPKGARGRRTRW